MRQYLNYEALISELEQAIQDVLQDNIQASDIGYDNTTSGLTADDVQEAIDELQAEIGNLTFSLDTAVVSNTKSSGSVGAMTTTTQTISVSKEGYKVTGLGGVASSNNEFKLISAYISSVSDGSAVVTIKSFNTSASAQSTTFSAYVMFSKI
jgi:hypothetical protein